ncbi:MAG: hypothetical protein EHM49_04700 [Deltaproteobacteria bacterium]|nr:MAG: hypothetical protein EHM49_04700 [Deltaproteobacteria bacterium]
MQILNHDPYTGEWCYRGIWYDHYPADKIEADEAAREDYIKQRLKPATDQNGKNAVPALPSEGIQYPDTAWRADTGLHWHTGSFRVGGNSGGSHARCV